MPALWMYYDARLSPLLEDLGRERVLDTIAGRARPPARPLFHPLTVREAVVLRHRSGGEILVTHGHKGELWSHRPELPSPQDPPYMNCGSCVHPRCITALEIESSEVSLVKWHVSTQTAEGLGQGSRLRLMRTVLEGPVPLEEYFRKDGRGGAAVYGPRTARTSGAAV